MQQALLTWIWGFSVSLLCRSSQTLVGLDGDCLWTAIFTSLQGRWVQFRALTGPLKDVDRAVLKPLLCCLGCVFRTTVLLEAEISVSFRIFLWFTLFSFSVSDRSFFPCCWETSSQPDDSSTCFTITILDSLIRGVWFPAVQILYLEVRSNCPILVSRPDNIVYSLSIV